MGEALSSEHLAILEAALAVRPSTRRHARTILANFEAGRVSMQGGKINPEEMIEAWDLFALLWVHRNAGFVTDAEYERYFKRVEDRSPLGRVRRSFELSSLPRVAQFLQTFRRQPTGVIDPFSRNRRLRPLAEIQLLADLPISLSKSGLQPSDRLIVHIGSAAYDGALVFFSLEEPAPAHKLGAPIVCVGRLLSSEAASSKSRKFRSVVIRVRDDDPAGVELAPGEVRVEAVIFNRPDLLTSLPCN